MQKCLLFLLLFTSKTLFSQVNDNFRIKDSTGNQSLTNQLDTKNEDKQRHSLIHSFDQKVYVLSPELIQPRVKWEFLIEHNSSASSQDQARIYLISDKENFRGSLNGYFVELSENGNTYSYKLFRQQGNTTTPIISGVPRPIPHDNYLKTRVQVTKDEQNTWMLETSADKDTLNTLEGTVIETPFVAGNYFGMYCTYTTANSAEFIFSDILIETLTHIDNEPPKLTSVTVLDSTTLEVTFSEDLDSTSLKNILSYSLDNDYGSPVIISPTNNSTVFHLKFKKRFVSGSYLLSVSGIKDLYNNSILDNQTFSFTYQKPYLVKKGAVVINEIFADPTPIVGLPNAEFIEILNMTSETINLKDWEYRDAVSKTKLPDSKIGAGSYLILCAAADTGKYKIYGQTLGISPWPTLNNTDDILKLISPDSRTIDSLSYFDSWYQHSSKKQGGWSLERIDPSSECEGIFNWIASKDPAGGTPGEVNSTYFPDFDKLALEVDSVSQPTDSTLWIFFNKPLGGTPGNDLFTLQPFNQIKTVRISADRKQVNLLYQLDLKDNTTYKLSIENVSDCAGNNFSTGSHPLTFTTKPGKPLPPDRTDTSKIYITEIFADPSPEVGLPLVEFVEIHNPSKDTVNLEGWTLNDAVTKGTIRNANILPQQYLILCPLADTTKYQPFGQVVGISPWPTLNNLNDEVSLKSHTKRTVDSIGYTDKWYQDNIKKQGGWTLERIFNDSKCEGFYNWGSSVDPAGGTPGEINSIYKDHHVLEVTDITVLSDSTIKVLLNTTPDTANLKSSYFKLDQGIGNPVRATFDPENYAALKLFFKSKFVEGTKYTLTIESLITCAGTPIDSSNPLSFLIPEIPHRLYPIVINEIFADPTPVIGIPEVEFIELYNPTNSRVDLDGLIYEDASNTRFRFTSGAIEAGDYLILCPAKDTLSYKPFGNVLGLYPWPTLNNDKDILILKDNKGYEIHRVNYNSSWYKDREKQMGGYSLEMINPSSICSGIQNWNSSKDPSGATPGKENSIRSNTSGTPLALLEALVTDSITITLRFNNTIDSLSAANTNNYLLNNGMSGPLSASPVSPDFNSVKLTFSTPIGRGKNYKLTVSNIKDCVGNLIASNLNTIDFLYAVRIEKSDILINEILFNPRPNGADFVEIYNNSSKTLDLKDLSIASANEKDSLIQSRTISNTRFLFEPKQYLALTTDPENIKSIYLTESPEAFQKMTALPSFNDDAGVVILVAESTRIDQLNYSKQMHSPLIKNPEGVSLERISTKAATNDAGNFRSAAAAAGFATPGYKNSQSVEDLEGFEDVEFVSKTFSPDNDGFEDILLLNYHFEKPGMIANATIYNDQGALIKKLTRNQSLAADGLLSWDGLNEVNEKAPVGIYLIYLEVFDLSGKVKKYRKNFVLATKLD